MVFGLSYGFLFLRRERKSSPSICKEAPLATVYMLRLHDRFGLGYVRFFGRTLAVEELCLVHVSVSL